jgi:hypothetical protein
MTNLIANRRMFLIAATTLAAAPAFALISAPQGRRLAFNVLREGKKIGTHEVSFSRQGEAWTIDVTIDLAVSLGPVPLYRYRHRAREIWTSGQFTSIDADTNDNGSKLIMRAVRNTSGVAVNSTQSGDYVAPATALPSTHWNRRMLDVPFINTQTGELLRAAVSPLGTGEVEAATGAKIPVRRFEIRGPITLETWYDETSTWAGLRFKGHDGSQILYKRQEPSA